MSLTFTPLHFDKPVTYVERDGKVFPENLSATAQKILFDKFARKAGVPDAVDAVDEPDIPAWLRRSIPSPTARFGAESDARQIYHRMAGAWTYWGYRYGYFADESSARCFYNNMIELLARQIFAPNSPQWFNTGLHWAYGITGVPSGGFAADPISGEISQVDSAYERPQLSACFIQSVDDDLVNPGGIMDLWVREARVFKYGGGSGTNFSTIRAAGEPLSGGGVSSGLMSFLTIGDRAAGAIKSGGTTRRAAKMVVLDVDHPDIEEFIEWKVIGENKVAALACGSQVIHNAIQDIRTAYHSGSAAALRKAIKRARSLGIPNGRIQRAVDALKNGYADIVDVYDTYWEGEAYQTVSGQNANNSVRLDDRFITALRSDADYPLYWRTEIERARREGRPPRPVRTIKAAKLWRKIAEAAWVCADPGLQFATTINAWHTCPEDGEIRSSNPCGEFLFLDNSACNLGSIRLTAFYDPDSGRFDHEAFVSVVRHAILALEISTMMAQYPSRAIAEHSFTHRPLGLGFADLGGLLMRAGIPYDSDEGRGFAAAIAALMHCAAYETSAEIAKSVGPFQAFERNRAHMMRVIKNHYIAALDGPATEYIGLNVLPYRAIHHAPAYLREAVSARAKAMLDLGTRYGFRNSQVTAIAPTGTIGLYMDCDTTGIEPDFALVKYKTLAGGGYLKIVNQAIPVALKRLGYSPAEIDQAVHYVIGHGHLPDDHPFKQKLIRAGLTADECAQAIREISAHGDVKRAFALREYKDGWALLQSIGFSPQEVEALVEYVCGAGTLEGCPVVSHDHLSVFDCANRCGRRGQRYIAPQGHLLMMAAVQPFISGGISKTVNLPSDTTPDQIANIYSMAWGIGVKAIAVYRDGCKLSQPLNTALWDDEPDEEPEGTPVAAVLAYPRGIQEKLPPVRKGVTYKAKIGDQSVFLRTGEYPDGRLGEIFIDVSRAGTTLQSLLDCFSIAISIGLQYGAPLEEFVEKFTFTQFAPQGQVRGSPYLRYATSLIDYVFRTLAINYLGRRDLAHVSDVPTPMTQDAPPRNGKHPPIAGQAVGAMANGKHPQAMGKANPAPVLDYASGYTGEVCPVCGSGRMVRSGTCSHCEDCGATTGCS